MAFLTHIENSSDVRKLDRSALPALCQELRDYIIDTVSQVGGHFAANLGVIELTVALHHTLQLPEDTLIWDVGHQSYPHKVLSGRKDALKEIRSFKGISGFPKMKESAYDAFGTGHSSTSISAALGMSIADQLQGRKRLHVAVIGDSALTAGMAFEALNHAGASPADLLIVINDNSIGIDPAAGALNEHLLQLRKKNSVNNFFTALGISYHGPVDGHDVQALTDALQAQKELKGVRVLHCVTVKGKGYEPAEKEQTKWHSTAKFDKISGKALRAGNSNTLKFQEVFGHTLVELAEKNNRIVGITPAMPSGSSMDLMINVFPDRAFDVGIAEQHAVTFAAGLATKGMIPFCNIYSTFLQRAYDQVIHDVCLQEIPVIFCLDRAGIVGEDGPTHHGLFDIAFLSCIPNIIIASPLDEHELRNMMFTALDTKIPFAIRYPRGNGSLPEWKNEMAKIEVGKFRLLQEGERTAIISFGPIGTEVSEAIRELEKGSPAHFDARFAKPLDEVSLHQIFQKYEHVVTVEDGCAGGGFGAAIASFKSRFGYQNTLKIIAVPDEFVPHGTVSELRKMSGLDAASIREEVLRLNSERQ